MIRDTKSEYILLQNKYINKGKVAYGNSEYNLTYMAGSHFKRNVKLTLRQENSKLLYYKSIINACMHWLLLLSYTYIRHLPRHFPLFQGLLEQHHLLKEKPLCYYVHSDKPDRFVLCYEAHRDAVWITEKDFGLCILTSFYTQGNGAHISLQPAG